MHANEQFEPGDWVDTGNAAGEFVDIVVREGMERVRFRCEDTGEVRSVNRRNAYRAPSPTQIAERMAEIDAAYNGRPRECRWSEPKLSSLLQGSRGRRRGSTVRSQ